MKIKVFGTKIYISFLFAATLSFMIATDRTGLIIPTLFAVLVHETGHLFAMWVNDCAPKEIRLIPASVQIVESYPKSSGLQVWIIACGPLANIAVSAALFINYYLGKSEVSLQFGLLNMILALFNMLPVSGLDGGRIMVIVLSRRKSPYFAVKTVKVLTFVLSLTAFFAGITLAIRGNFNISVFILALYLAICTIIKT